MSNTVLPLLFLVPLLPAAIAFAEVEGRRPNFVVILADDMGYGDLACYGRGDIRTPNLDRLAAEGVRFTAHYANGPECTPTRVALLTGRYPQWVGGLECAIGIGNVGRYDDALRLSQIDELGLPAGEQTIVRLLKNGGYATAIVGKWHLGYGEHFSPPMHGFDESFYCVGGGMDYFRYGDTSGWYNLFRDKVPVYREGYFTDLVTHEAVTFLKQDRDNPFFLYVPYTAPHAPYQGPGEVAPRGLPPNSPRWSQGSAPPAVYISVIERMDEGIGNILQSLDERGLTQNTVVMFASDNGGTGSSRNDPLRGQKGSTYEGGIRVPAIIRYPGVVPAGSVSHQVSATFDLTSSIAAAAGVAPSTERPFEGIDIMRHVADRKPDIPRTLYWRKPRETTVWKGVREGALKYVCEQKGESVREQLFDVAADIGEDRDLSSTRPDDLQRLRAQFAAWEKTVHENRRGRPGWSPRR